MITIPQFLWDQMVDEFQKTKKRVEQIAYFDGVRSGSDGIATTLTIPDAKVSPGNFEVTSAAMSEAGKHLRRLRLVRLAQVHTHPTAWVGHSPWDDLKAYSQQPGAISIVLPDFARSCPSLAGAGVHMRDSEGWRQLSASAIGEYIRVVPSFYDFRKNDGTDSQPPRRRPWWAIFTFRRH